MMSPKDTLVIGVAPSGEAVNATDSYACSSSNEGSVGFTKAVCKRLRMTCMFECVTDSEAIQFGSYNGVLALLKQGKINTTTPIFAPTMSRLEDFVFADVVNQFTSVFVYREPTVVEYTFFKLVFPFHWNLCALVVASIVAVGITTAWIEWSLSIAGKKHHRLMFLDGVIDALNLTLNQSSYALEGTRFASNLLITFWALCGVILTGLYSAVLLSYVLNPPQVQPFTNQETLIQCISSKHCKLVDTTLSMKLSTLNGSHHALDVALSKALEMNPVMIEKNLTKFHDILALSNNEMTYVYWTYENTALHNWGDNCHYYIIPDERLGELVTFAFRNTDVQLQTLVNRAAQDIVQMGFGKRFARNDRELTIHDCDESRKTTMHLPRPFRLGSIYGPLLVATCGCIAASFVILVEIFVHYVLASRSFSWRLRTSLT